LLAAKKAKEEFRQQLKKNEQLVTGSRGAETAQNLISVEEVEFQTSYKLLN
jgi:hypothetical protein